ncbi:hypothetical protein [Rarobacter incanus]|uniref:Aerotaxis receptor n=1 Tax=Rarobacter incanus TaxID=153494 RepID=A0A542SMP4_9MICO|nr:hypothetical protein [Rarobacter incanus]TQK75517.1 aerotaxis receptor [Rarobacter incanus]
MGPSVIPTGVVRELPAGEILFSTTSREGIITGANSAFTAAMRYSLAELVGEPHSVVRHPDMPGGIYALWWSELLAGRPASAYMLNLAGDGASSWAFSVAVPVATDKFLSVRIEISCAEHHQVLRHAYDVARASERKMRNGGLSRDEAAAESATIINSLLAEAGYGSYRQMASTVVPQEVARWHRAPRPPLPAAVMREGHEIGRVLSATKEIDEELHQIRASAAKYTQLIDSLSAASQQLVDGLEDLVDAVQSAAHACTEHSDSAPVLVGTSKAAVTIAATAQEELEALPVGLQGAAADIAQLSLVEAIGELHSAAAESFAVEIARGAAGGDAMASLDTLVVALTDTVNGIDSLWRQVTASTFDVAARVEASTATLAEFRRMLLNWRNLVVRFRRSHAVAQYLSEVDRREAATRRQMAALLELAQSAHQLGAAVDVDSMRSAIGKLDARH